MYKEIKKFKEIIVECDLYGRQKELGKEFFVSFNIDETDDEYNLDFISCECKCKNFEIELIIGGQKISSCVIDNNFTEEKLEILLDELNNCKEKTYFVVDNNEDIIYKIIIK